MYIVSVLAFVLFLSVDGSPLNFLSSPNKNVEPKHVTSPLHVGEQNYLSDNVAKRQVGDITANMRETGNGFYEFNVGGQSCKFFVDRRQIERSLMCNNKKCLNEKNTQNRNDYWSCNDISCTISNNSKKAVCQEKDPKHVIDAPSRAVVCPKGQSKVDGHCRNTYN